MLVVVDMALALTATALAAESDLGSRPKGQARYACDNVEECDRVARKLHAVHGKLLGYLGGKEKGKGGEGVKPTLGWTAFSALERLALYAGGVTEPVILTELKKSWQKKRTKASKNMRKIGAESTQVADDEYEVEAYSNSCVEFKDVEAKMLIPLALKERLKKGPDPLPKGRRVRLQGTKALNAKLLSPTESILLSIETRKQEDLKYLAELGVQVKEVEEKLVFDQVSTNVNPEKTPPILCCRVVSIAGSAIRVELLQAVGIPNCSSREMELFLHPSQSALADMVFMGDHLVIEFPKAQGKQTFQLSEANSGEIATKVKCTRGMLFHHIQHSSSAVGGSNKEVTQFRTLVGTVSEVYKDGAQYKLVLQDSKGSTCVEMHFTQGGKWNAGLVERGHMVALTGVADLSVEEKGASCCKWEEGSNEEASIYNLSCIHSRLFSSFMMPSTPLENRFVLKGLKNIRVKVFHKRCMRCVQNVVMDFFDDDEAVVESCSNTNASKQTQTPETPCRKSGGLFECSFCNSDCLSDDVTLGYSGSVELELFGGNSSSMITAAADAPALRNIIQMHTLYYKKLSRGQRKAHLDTLRGQCFSVLFYEKSSARRRITLGDSTNASNADEANLCIALAVKY